MAKPTNRPMKMNRREFLPLMVAPSADPVIPAVAPITAQPAPDASGGKPNIVFAYAWLGQRLHRVDPSKPAFVPWVSLKEQFGHGYHRMDNFKRVFRTTLRQVAIRRPS